MKEHDWDYEENQYCVDRIFEYFVMNRQYDYEILLDELYVHFDMKIKRTSLKMFLSNVKHLFNEYNIPNTLEIAELTNISFNTKYAFSVAMKKFNEEYLKRKNGSKK